ncbi:hypothetical protein [Acidithiobacillus thiooxidans]|uniref:hypothetical protein n=1 Tax=Acidithiobacillus thiooxidans TaxID=930 RepID=UPI0009D92574|nr:hypothetical protein [Acidithiobacillus thiooxidans]
MAFSVMAHADSSMLVTADGGFYSYAFWKHALVTNTRLLFRLSSVVHPPPRRGIARRVVFQHHQPQSNRMKKQSNGVTGPHKRIRLEGHPRC